MKPLKSVLLTVVMISGLAAWAAGIYSADASADHVAVDGYGVTAAVR
jgi:glutamate synthase domain-containing protein 2